MALIFISRIVLVLILVMLGPTVSAGVLDYNVMSCIDFVRHMGGTVPSRFGLFGTAAAAKRQQPELTAQLQNVLSTVTNVGNVNIEKCQSVDRHSFCVSIDDFLEQNFPQWFFDYKVTKNVNHLVGQITTHRYHALFEAGLKFYSCFCDC